jgi:hypothetical protein
MFGGPKFYFLSDLTFSTQHMQKFAVAFNPDQQDRGFSYKQQVQFSLKLFLELGLGSNRTSPTVGRSTGWAILTALSD